jgi:hypothetical protein
VNEEALDHWGVDVPNKEKYQETPLKRFPTKAT